MRLAPSGKQSTTVMFSCIVHVRNARFNKKNVRGDLISPTYKSIWKGKFADQNMYGYETTHFIISESCNNTILP